MLGKLKSLGILHLTIFHGFCILLTTEVVHKIFPSLNAFAHLVVPAGWGSCLATLAIFMASLCGMGVDVHKQLVLQNNKAQRHAVSFKRYLIYP